MRLLKRFAAPAGSLVLLSSLATYLIVPELSNLVSVLLGTGLVLVLLGLMLNFSSILDRIKGRAVREGGGDVAYIIIVAVVLCLLNFLAARHNGHYDWTEGKTFSLSDQTKKILSNLPRAVEAKAYYYPGTQAETKMKDLLEEYGYAGKEKFTVRFIDPLKDPSQAKADAVTQEQSVVLKSGPNSTTVVAGDEEAITNAILKVTRDQTKTLCLSMGHGERDPKDSTEQGLSVFQGSVEKQQAKVETFSPGMGVPAHCAAVVVAGPQKPWLPAEVEKLQAYLDQGGKAAILLDPGIDSGLEVLMARYGVTPGHDVIIDRVSALFGGKPDIPMVPADGYESHAITKGFRYQTFYPLATSLTLDSPAPAGVELQALARTTPLSWGEVSYETEAPTGKLRMDPKDKQGPLTLAAVATKKLGEPPAPGSPPAEPGKSQPETRLAVFGDSDFASNAYFGGTSDGELFLNVVNWLSGQEDLVAIGAKSRAPVLVTLSQRQASFIWIVSILVAPATILLVGTVLWVRRRKL
ncbi:MAG: GldG family protein [Acidobacteria bacterium]|nr:GldG family protein [Acidobacteriota bacterium]